MTVPWATATASAGLAGLAAFQATLAAGAPWGVAAYGGRPGRLPVRLRRTSAGAAIGYATLATFVASGAGTPMVRRGMFITVAALLGLAVLPNLASPSRWSPRSGRRCAP